MRVLRRSLWIGAGLYWLAMLIATHLPPVDVPPVGLNDKLEHFMAYGGLALLVLGALSARGKKEGQWDWLVLAGCIAYGAADEWLQIPVGRSCELADWAADAAGAGLAVGVFGLVRFLVQLKWGRVAAQAPVGASAAMREPTEEDGRGK